jgi:hypothetical protein
MEGIAKTFFDDTKKKYIFDLSNYHRTMGPDTFARPAVKRAALVQYNITFTDLSEARVILNKAQYWGLRRSKWWSSIKMIGGEGHRELAG